MSGARRAVRFGVVHGAPEAEREVAESYYLVSRAEILVKMARWEDRDISQRWLMRSLQERLSRLPGLEVFVTETAIVGGQRGDPLKFKLHGPDLERVVRLAVGKVAGVNVHHRPDDFPPGLRDTAGSLDGATGAKTDRSWNAWLNSPRS